MRIVGTAGHVDHGKSSLVISLTGHNPDRWAEERERGMTLDLGFAALRFPDGIEAGIIDVPGHERFLHNMLAGAAGIDLLLLVVDALEGPRAQTREHLQILQFLNVRRAIVVLTKSDLADRRTLDEATRLTREACEGTVADGAPLIAVSNATGAGIDALKIAIHDTLASLPPRRTDAPPYLPIDRVFALQGHGTIVTGTLLQGTIATGDVLTVQPSRQSARVRSLQIFGKKVGKAEAGSRVAVNLAGVDVDTIRRGDVLAAPREFAPVTQVVLKFTPLAAALPLLRKKTPVRVHVGAAEIEGRLLLDQPLSDASTTARARVELSGPIVFYRGMRVVLRSMSPKVLLGGGVLVDAVQHGSLALAAAPGDDGAQPDDEACLAVLEAAGLAPLAPMDVAARANVRETAAVAALSRLASEGRIAHVQKPPAYLSRAAYDAAFERAANALRERHERAPWRHGCSASEIALALAASDGLALRLLAAWLDDGRIAHRAQFWHMPDFKPSLTKEQRTFFDAALAGDPRSPLLPVSYDDVTKSADVRKIVGAREALESLVVSGALARVGDDVYTRSQIERARTILEDLLRTKPEGATMSQLRDAFGTSRKYALPLLEHFDSLGFTIRDGDRRRLRVTTGKSAAQVQV